MAKFNLLGVAAYSATGKVFGEVPYKHHLEKTRAAASEGIVLLKNENKALPIKPQKIGLFGCGSEDTSICGTGSGYAFSPNNVTIAEGLKNAGFEISSKSWLKNYRKFRKQEESKGPKLTFLQKRFSGIVNYSDAKTIEQNELDEAKVSNSVIYVIKRMSGETFDRKAIKGDYYLSDNEKNNLKLLSDHFENVIVVLNACIIDTVELNKIKNVNAIVLMGEAGMQAGNSLADVLTGNVTPSGKLTDTFALRYEDYPASATFSENDGETLLEEYHEGIFVGYRHFDSKKLDVAYPFGYGLSYTTFEFGDEQLTVNDNVVTIKTSVKNTGTCKGKEVVQVYVSAPKGKLNKPYQELRGYQKTALLKSGESQTVEINIPLRDLCSYDESSASWILEKGNYLIRVGNSSRNTRVIGTIVLDETKEVVRLSNQFALDAPLMLNEYPTNEDHEAQGIIVNLQAKDIKTFDEASKISKTVPAYVCDDQYQTKKGKYRFPIETNETLEKVRKVDNATLLDVVDEKITMEEFVATLDEQVLLRIVTGSGQETKYEVQPRLPKGTLKSNYNQSTSGKTTNMFCESLGIPAFSMADGPAGLHLMGTPSSCFPVGMVLAQTWNDEVVYEIGTCYGKEMDYYDIAVCLGPGMNIHRDPLCGRNFEYYSEDPLLTGNSAAAFTNGLQIENPGYGVSAKHFACNNQEIDRPLYNSRVSERALREIYLKGFEIMVKKSQPLTVMSSYNQINGIHTSSRYDLLTDVLRGEWGFKGIVMTDWDGESDRSADLYAGNDIIMGGYNTDELYANMNHIEPQFNEDGTVKQKEIAMYGGAFKKKIDMYNSFLLNKGGTDTYEVRTKNPDLAKLKALEEKGLLEIVKEEDETKLIYKGFDKSDCLPLSSVQRNAIRILKLIINNSPMKKAKRG